MIACDRWNYIAQSSGRAESNSMIGMPSRIGKARPARRLTNSFAGEWHSSAPLVFGQTRNCPEPRINRRGQTDYGLRRSVVIWTCLPMADQHLDVHVQFVANHKL